ncbi:MAG TPA: site-2 protease family protein [Terriglobales bacterium]|jgi:Zn-dependent protease|nr:site-2 protease family protein [Terriglobales bacterium]
MPTGRSGSIRLFRIFGIDVFLHWSWFLLAYYEINARKGAYSSIGWNIAEYLALFLIVTIHEFGHALACRQVGGEADRIVLWPFGGVAYVNPPQRPGATLWSIAAGPLVNVVLVPIILLVRQMSLVSVGPDLPKFADAVLVIDVGLLVFNILPIYPLDGGQILRSLLWFVMGRARSLLVASILGLVGIAAFIGYAILKGNAWLGAIAFFLLLNCWSGLQHARALLRFAKLPRRFEYSCPSCQASPPIGEYWKCGKCGNAFDSFQTGAVCPHCATRYEGTRCLDCGATNPMGAWSTHGVTVNSSLPTAHV